MDDGRVSELWRYPVKSFQGAPCQQLSFTAAGVDGDRRWALLDLTTGRVASAKRLSALLGADAGTGTMVLPGGERVAPDGPDAAERLSAWLGRPVRVVTAAEAEGRAYQMTFDPPDDTAEVVDIPLPTGSLVDLAPVHLINRATLDHCARVRPDLDWDVRRFRPNVVVDIPAEPFGEDSWVGHGVRLGPVELRPQQPTVRCAMPLRAQPPLDDRPALERQPALFAAMSELHGAFPNHLGVYCSVAGPGEVAVGDPARLVD